MPTQWAFLFGLEPLSDALCVEVVLDVAGQRGDLCLRVELHRADNTLIISLEFLRIVNILGQPAQYISLFRLSLFLPESHPTDLLEDAREAEDQGENQQARDEGRGQAVKLEEEEIEVGQEVPTSVALSVQVYEIPNSDPLPDWVTDEHHESEKELGNRVPLAQ